MRRVLLDTNVLLRYLQTSDPAYVEVRNAIEALLVVRDELIVTPQGLRELWVVATRPTHVNGFGFSPGEAERMLRIALRTFRLADDEPGIFADWLKLVVKHGVSGTKVHDANHAATARHHGITHVLTLNPKDFQRYALSGLSVLTPSDVNR